MSPRQEAGEVILISAVARGTVGRGEPKEGMEEGRREEGGERKEVGREEGEGRKEGGGREEGRHPGLDAGRVDVRAVCQDRKL